MPKTKTKTVRLNFTMYPADVRRLDALARMMTPSGERPSASHVIRRLIAEAFMAREKAMGHARSMLGYRRPGLDTQGMTLEEMQRALFESRTFASDEELEAAPSGTE